MPAPERPNRRPSLEQRLKEEFRLPALPQGLPPHQVAEFFAANWTHSMAGLEAVAIGFERGVLRPLEVASMNSEVEGRGPRQRCAETLKNWQAALDRSVMLLTPERLGDVPAYRQSAEACLAEAVRAYRHFLSDRFVMLYNDGVVGRMELFDGGQFRLTFEVRPESFPDGVLEHVTRDEEPTATILRTSSGFVEAAGEFDRVCRTTPMPRAARSIGAGCPPVLRNDLYLYQGTSYRRTLGDHPQPIGPERYGWLEFQRQVLLHWTIPWDEEPSLGLARFAADSVAWAAGRFRGFGSQKSPIPELHPILRDEEEDDP